MKTIVLYTRRQVGLYALSLLKGLGYAVKVISDDENVLWLAKELNCDIVTFDSMRYFDLFLCVHGNKIIKKELLKEGRMVNIHPCLFKYKGHNPIKRFIVNGDTEGSVESHYMVEEVDAGEVIHQEFFKIAAPDFATFYNASIPYYFKTIVETLKKVGI